MSLADTFRARLDMAEAGILAATTDADLAHWLGERRRVLDAMRAGL